ncbi:MAG: response regulator [Elusimicrobiales bacterium]
MTKKVLVVDDEELVRNYVRRALASRGWEVIEARNGTEALSHTGRADLAAAICDLKMPDIRGEEVVKAFKTARPDLPVIVITGSVSNIATPIVPGVEVQGFLIKPFGIDEIRDLLARVTGG